MPARRARPPRAGRSDPTGPAAVPSTDTDRSAASRRSAGSGPADPTGSGPDHDPAFARLVADVRPRLRTALVAHYGVDLGVEATSEALAWAWEHRAELAAMDNPGGYLFRVGQTAVRRDLRQRRAPLLPPVPSGRTDDIDPDLPAAVAELSEQQRAAVLLVHAHGWTLTDAAGVLGISVSTLRNHLERGLRRLRDHLEPPRA